MLNIVIIAKKLIKGFQKQGLQRSASGSDGDGHEFTITRKKQW